MSAVENGYQVRAKRKNVGLISDNIYMNSFSPLLSEQHPPPNLVNVQSMCVVKMYY